MTEIAGWRFDDPAWLALLLLLPLVALLRRRKGVPAIVVPEAQNWHVPRVTPLPWWPIACAYLGLTMLIVGLARPQVLTMPEDQNMRGYDFIIAIDLSTSMYAEDFQRGATVTNRLQAVKPIISAFINERPSDRIGVVVFAGRAYTFAPLTFDHDWLRKQTARLSIGLIEDGTAIGDAIAVSLTRLREGWKDDGELREGSFIVLLTDGSSNKGSIDPRQAAGLAAADSVAIYTIGAGAEGMVTTPIFDYAGNRIGTEQRESRIDTLLLDDIASSTGGLFFRATDENAIKEAFESIDQAEKTTFDAAPPLVSHELFVLFALVGTATFAAAAYGAGIHTQVGERA
ncbi:VWA domain-containing protein [Woeseia oceani]|uniref:VWA domain-containing protein n=1 Tax=Woeseia oceani TaxID=1548547 RepID=UPI000AC1A510|nr:VWA domain-containing protein [Woeseia oceani]